MSDVHRRCSRSQRLSRRVSQHLPLTLMSSILFRWNSVAIQIIAVVNEQLVFYPDYGLVTLGHSLGGAMAALAAISLRMNFPDNLTRCYSYGAPRTGVLLQ